MYILTIFLGITIFILSFTILLYLYNRFLKGVVIYDLKKSNPSISVIQPTSPNYYFSVWIYVNSFVNEGVKNNSNRDSYDNTRVEIGKPIFYYGSPFTTDFFTYSSTENVDFVYLQLGANSPKLQYYFSPDINNDYKKCHFVNITENIPLQKWTHVVIGTTGNILDFYLDGKLVQSYNHNTSPNIFATQETMINIGKRHTQIPHDTFISKIERVPKPIDSKTAYDLYKKGPGTGLNTGNMSKYDISMQLVQNNNVIKTYSTSSIANIFK